MITTEELKTRLTQARLATPQMTFASISELTGLSEKTIRRYEDPKSSAMPSLHTMAIVCKHYGLSIDMLAYGGKASATRENRFIMTFRWFLQKLTEEESKALDIASTAFIRILVQSAGNSGVRGEIVRRLKPKK